MHHFYEHRSVVLIKIKAVELLEMRNLQFMVQRANLRMITFFCC